MALKPKIQALIDLANETTEAGDVTLGDAVKTLADGYNGGANAPSSPLVIPSGEMSAKLAALLAYSNEVTGAGDTRMGDAIKTLCEGWGGGSDLVFYDRLVGDGVAYIDTGVRIAATDVIYMEVKCGVKNAAFFGARSSYNGYLSLRQANVAGSSVYLRIGSASNTTIATDGIHVQTVAIELNLPDLVYHSGTKSGTLPRNTGLPTITSWLFREHSTYDSPTSGVSTFSSFKLTRNGEVILDLKPCTYLKEPGMWDMVSETFFGNSNPSGGAFSVER